MIFLKIFEDSTLHGTLGKKFFWKSHPKTSSKHVWTLLGRNLCIFGILKNFWFFWKFSKTRPSMEHWAKICFEKTTPKLVQNTLGHFLEQFWAFLWFWNFFDFEIFRLDTFGDDFGHFWIFETFLIFLKKSEDSTFHGTLGKKKFFKKITLKHLQNTFGHFWERFCAFLEFWNFFWFWKFSFGHFWGRFWAFWNFETFLIFLKIFEDSTLHGTLGKKFFRKNHPKTSSKHVWTLLGSNLGIFGISKIFWFFWKLSKTRPSIEHWAKSFFEKITLKHLQNTFGLFWGRFWAFLEFWNFFDFFEIFRRLDPPWNTAQKIFSKKSP